MSPWIQADWLFLTYWINTLQIRTPPFLNLTLLWFLLRASRFLGLNHKLFWWCHWLSLSAEEALYMLLYKRWIWPIGYMRQMLTNLTWEINGASSDPFKATGSLEERLFGL